jgi:hypothetical protein
MGGRAFWENVRPKANSRRVQRAGMLSRSWLKFVLITIVYTDATRMRQRATR